MTVCLAGRTALVTGAGRGIGFAIAEGLGDEGARVVLVGRDRDRLAAARASLAGRGVDADVVEGDVRAPETLAAVERAAPTVDVLVNNAAAYAPFAVVERATDDDFDDVHRTVVDGARRLVQLVLPGMKRRGFGRIVMIGSLSAELGGAGQAAYTTAKAALVGLTRSVAVECAGRGVTVNLVEPGLIGTERIDEAVEPRVLDRIVARIPAGRMGLPHEVAHLVTALASPRAGYVTGAVIPVSGGLGLGLFSGDPA